MAGRGVGLTVAVGDAAGAGGRARGPHAESRPSKISASVLIRRRGPRYLGASAGSGLPRFTFRRGIRYEVDAWLGLLDGAERCEDSDPGVTGLQCSRSAIGVEELDRAPKAGLLLIRAAACAP